MAKTANVDHKRARKYRVEERRQGGGKNKNWACLDLGSARESGYPEDECRIAEARQEVRKRSKEPRQESGWNWYQDDEYGGGYQDVPDYDEPVSRRNGILMRSAYLGEAIRNLPITVSLKKLMALAAVFAGGVILENRLGFVQWIIKSLAAAVLPAREWLATGNQNALLWTALLTLSGVWLLTRMVMRQPGSPARKRGAIPREMMDRYL